MKRMNKSGVTLIEFVFVIISVSIIIGFAMPLIQDYVNTSRKKKFEISVDIAKSYLHKQAQLAYTNKDKMDDAYKKDYPGYLYVIKNDNQDDIKKMKKIGFDPKNVREYVYMLQEDGSACIIIKSIPKNSKYYTAIDWEPGDATNEYYVPKKDSDIKYKSGYGCE